MKITVTGSLGNISKPLAKQLVDKGHAVTIISSNAEKRKDIEALGAQATIGSLDDTDFLTSAFTGADTVYCMVPPNFTEPDQVAYYSRIAQNYANAIQSAGVSHIVHLSSYGAHLNSGTGFILGSHYAEGILNKLQGTHLTHLRPAYFYANLYGFMSMIKEAGFIGANYGGDDKMVLVHRLDIAAAAAEEIEISSPGIKVRYVASDEHTASEIAQILGAAIGKPGLKWLTFTDEQAREGLEKSGIAPHIAANFVDMGASTHSGALRQDYELHKPDVMGKVKLEDFAVEFVAAFNAGPAS